jgi:putative restriction endonuclease
MNPRNGICLCTLHDMAYDRGLLHVGEDFSIDVSPTIFAAAECETIQRLFIGYIGHHLALPDRWHPDPTLIRRHNELHSARN